MEARSRPEWRTTALQALEVATVGLPFATFKAIVGLDLLAGPFWMAGWALIGLAAVDGTLNLVNLGALLVTGERRVPACVLDRLAGGDLGLALDMALSFLLVAAMIGFGRLPNLPLWLLQTWNLAVILNVLGAGTARVAQSWAARR